MLITRTSGFTGVEHTRDIPVDWKDYIRWLDGALIQDAMPYLSPDDREFLMTGATPEEWDNLFAGMEE